jgi:hypothetical protein
VAELIEVPLSALFDRNVMKREPWTLRGATVEVAHEAILREWGRLREWLAESRADVRLQRQLALAAADRLQQRQGITAALQRCNARRSMLAPDSRQRRRRQHAHGCKAWSRAN